MFRQSPNKHLSAAQQEFALQSKASTGYPVTKPEPQAAMVFASKAENRQAPKVASPLSARASISSPEAAPTA